jgi:hypothetical protein
MVVSISERKRIGSMPLEMETGEEQQAKQVPEADLVHVRPEGTTRKESTEKNSSPGSPEQ